jgi:hypothetical protein
VGTASREVRSRAEINREKDNEKDRPARDDARHFGVRDNAAADANLPGRLGDSCGPSVSAASASATAGNDDLPGWHRRHGRNAVPGASASAAAATAAALAVGRTRLIEADRGPAPACDFADTERQSLKILPLPNSIGAC